MPSLVLNSTPSLKSTLYDWPSAVPGEDIADVGALGGVPAGDIPWYTGAGGPPGGAWASKGGRAPSRKLNASKTGRQRRRKRRRWPFPPVTDAAYPMGILPSPRIRTYRGVLGGAW